jgi:hypothetical protein
LTNGLIQRAASIRIGSLTGLQLSYDAVLEALQNCRLPLQPLVATPQLLARHGDTPFWRTLRQKAIPLLAGSHFP